MTRLSEALKRAAETTAAPRATTAEPPPPTGVWQFAPVETMYVPDEPAAVPVARHCLDVVVPDQRRQDRRRRLTDAPPRAIKFGAKDRDKLVVGEIPIQP